MNKAISYLLCWCLCASLAAQTHVVDSLVQILASGKLKDEEKAVLLKNIANQYAEVDTAKCRMYALEAIREAQNVGSKKVEAAANIAIANSFREDTAKRRIYAMKALRMAQNNKGLELEEAVAHITLGNHYYYEGLYYISHVHYRNAEKLLLQLNDKARLDIVYNNLMFLFQLIDDNTTSIYYADKLLEMAVEAGDLERELYIIYVVGSMQYKEKRHQEALDYYLELYRKSVLLNSRYASHIALSCADQYTYLNRPREALSYLRRAHEAYEAGVRGMNISTIYFLFAKAYAISHQVDSSEYFIKKAMDSPFIQDGIREKVFYTRSFLDSIRGDYRSALENYKHYHRLSDSIAKAGKTAEIARMKNWHELEQKDHENQLLQRESQKQHRLILILAGALAMIFVLLALSLFFYRKTAEKNRELKKLNTVKDKLFSIVAHDLRNPMGALMSVLKLANKNMLDAETQARLLKDISTRVDDTYNLIDNLLHWSKSQMQGMVPSPVYFDVQDGSRTITDSLQHIAAIKAITLNNHIEKQQIYADRDMFAVVVRNLCMNAIKYTSAGDEVTLASEQKDGVLIVSVKDTGTGMSQEVQDQLFKLSETKSRRGTNNEIGTGLGLVLCADFVKANGGSIWFTSKEGEGSTFFFSIPVNILR